MTNIETPKQLDKLVYKRKRRTASITYVSEELVIMQLVNEALVSEATYSWVIT